MVQKNHRIQNVSSRYFLADKTTNIKTSSKPIAPANVDKGDIKDVDIEKL